MRDQIEQRYTTNLSRVRRLIESYRELGGTGSGRRPVETVDLLRAAVVFLHATLEDLLRELLLQRWPEHGLPEQFEDVPVAARSGRPQVKLTLADLVPHRGKSVNGVIREAIEAHLERSSFNNVGEVKTALARSGIAPGIVTPHAGRLAAMMSRRHQIVHRADRLDVGGMGRHAAASLGVGTVNAWFDAVEAVCGEVVACL